MSNNDTSLGLLLPIKARSALRPTGFKARASRHFESSKKRLDLSEQLLGADQIITPNHFMQPEKIVLLPPSHESLPSFHVQAELLPAFLDHLANSGIKTPEPPEPQGTLGPGGIPVVEIDIEEGTSLKRLQEVLDEFLKRQGLPGSGQKS